jgi:hypothetical protein
MMFYAFDHEYGNQQDLCLFACGEYWNRVSRGTVERWGVRGKAWSSLQNGMMSTSDKIQQRDAIKDLKDGDWSPTIKGMMEEPSYSDPVDIMWAFNGYHRLFLNSLNDPAEPAGLMLNGWTSSGRIFHSIMANKYDPNTNHIEYVVDKRPVIDVPRRHIELRKRGVNKEENIKKAAGKLLHALTRFLTLWTWSSVTTEMVRGSNSLYGGYANQRRDAENKYLQNMNSPGCKAFVRDGSSIRIDAQSGIMEYPEYPGLRFANIQIQYQTDTYARIELPIGIEIGARRIRQALLEALREAPNSVRIVPNPERGGMTLVTRHRLQPLAIDWVTMILFVVATVAGPSNTKGKGR